MSTDQEWVLPLVVRIERAEPPTRTDALEAAAMAVLSMVADPEPGWRDAVRSWDGSRIRKVVRRARGAEWRRAVELPGRTITHGTAQVRVFPPIPLDGWPPELARLQVGGTELDDVDAPADAGPDRPLVLLAPDVDMSAGKAMAQVGHAAQLGWRAANAELRTRWRDTGYATDVRTATDQEWRAALADGVPLVHDAGFTEVPAGSATAAVRLRSGSTAEAELHPGRSDWSWTASAPTQVSRSPVQWARAVLEDAPWWARWALSLGWRFGLWLDIGRMDTPGRVLGWRVATDSDALVVLAARSPLGLDSRLVFTAPDGRVAFETDIRCTNRPMRAVWAAVVPLHKVMATWMVRRAARG